MRYRILVVDDIPINVEILNEILQDKYDVTAALNGGDAIKLAMGISRPDLILLDVQLPDMDGYEICKILKMNDKTKNIPVIFVTTLDSELDESEGFRMGGVDYITKPISPPVLEARIKLHLALYSQNRALEEMVNLRTAELHEAKVQAESAYKLKTAFLANLNHELRTPLNAVMGLTQLLLESAPTEKQEMFLREELKAIKKLVTMIESILELSQFEAGKIELHNTEFKLQEILNALRMLYSEQLKGTDVELRVIEPDKPYILTADYKKILQILVNLLNNAVRYTQDGAIEVSVCCVDSYSADSSDSDGVSTVIFTVEDTGVGIPNDKMDYVFEAFNITEHYLNKERDGLGIGLTTASHLVKAMGGGIHVDSAVNRGTKIVFSVPCCITS